MLNSRILLDTNTALEQATLNIYRVQAFIAGIATLFTVISFILALRIKNLTHVVQAIRDQNIELAKQTDTLFKQTKELADQTEELAKQSKELIRANNRRDQIYYQSIMPNFMVKGVSSSIMQSANSPFTTSIAKRNHLMIRLENVGQLCKYIYENIAFGEE
jgi:cell division protein FtsB